VDVVHESDGFFELTLHDHLECLYSQTQVQVMLFVSIEKDPDVLVINIRELRVGLGIFRFAAIGCDKF